MRIDNVQNIISNPYNDQKIPIPSKLLCISPKRCLSKTKGILRAIVIISLRNVRVSKGIINIIVVFDIMSNQNTSRIDNRNFPVLFVVCLAHARKYRRIQGSPVRI